MSPQAPQELNIESFSAARAGEFRRLNAEWIERYFTIEPADAAILGDPQGHIIAPGGEIFFAVEHGRALGTCAVKPVGDGRVELSKMAVTPRAQGRGVGRRLLGAALEWFLAREEPVLFLESHRSLGAALKLYESAGFRHCERPDVSRYERCDVYMEWSGEGAPGRPGKKIPKRG